MYRPSELSEQIKKLNAQVIWLNTCIARKEVTGFRKLKTELRINLTQRCIEDLNFQIIMIAKNHAKEKTVHISMIASEKYYNENKKLIGRIKENVSKK